MVAQNTLPIVFDRNHAEAPFSDMVFTSTTALNNYLTDPRRYAGQIAALNEGGDVTLYKLNSARDTWEEVSGGGAGGLDQWSGTTIYAIGDVVWESGTGRVYRAIANHTSDPTFLNDLANWSELSPKDLSSSLIENGNVVVVNGVDATQIDIPQYEGLVIDSYTNPEQAPVINHFVRTAITVTVPDVATTPAKFVWLDSTGAVVFTDILPVHQLLEEFRDKVFVCTTIHSGGVVVAINNAGAVPYNQFGNHIMDLALALGPLNLSGNVFSGVAASLQMQKTAGYTFLINQNVRVNPKNPNVALLGALNPVTFGYTWKNGLGGYNVDAFTNLISPSDYDDGTGTKGSVANNQWSIQRIWLIQPSSVFVHLGQAVYSSKADAIDGLQTEAFEANPALETAIYRGALIVKGNATNLADATQAIFVPADKFGTRFGAGGATGAITDLQQAYINSIDPEFLLTSTIGGISLVDAASPIGSYLFEIQNNARDTRYLGVTDSYVEVTDKDGRFLVEKDISTIWRENFKESNPTDLYTVTGNGTLANKTASPIDGFQSATFTQVAGSAGATIELTNGIALDGDRALDRHVGLLNDFKYSGNTGDIQLRLLESSDDVTYTVVGGNDAYLDLSNTTSSMLAQLGNRFKTDTTHFKIRYTVATENIGAVLEWRNTRLVLDPSETIGLVEREDTITKILSADVTTNTVISDFTISASELTEGKRYFIVGPIYHISSNDGGTSLAVRQGSEVITDLIFNADGPNTEQKTIYMCVEFVADGVNDVTFTLSSASATEYIVGNNTKSESYIQVVNMPTVTERVVFKSGSKIKYAESAAFWGFGQRDGSNRVRLANKETESTDSELISGVLGTGSTATRVTLLKDCMVGAGSNGASSGDVGINIYASNGTLRYRVAESTGIRAGVPVFYPCVAGDYIMMTATADLDNNDLTSFSVVAILAEIDPSALFAVPLSNKVLNGVEYFTGKRVAGAPIMAKTWEDTVLNDATILKTDAKLISSYGSFQYDATNAFSIPFNNGTAFAGVRRNRSTGDIEIESNANYTYEHLTIEYLID